MTPADHRADIRAFVDAYVATRAAEFDREGRIDPALLKEFASRGYWGAVLPTTGGGTGGSMVAFAELHEEVGRGCSSMRSLLTVHSMVLHALDRWGTAAARERWRTRMVAGDALGAFCLSEPEAGSDFAALVTSARRDGDSWLISGRKLWVTGGGLADVLLVFARTDIGPTAFLVDADTPGIRRIRTSSVTGTRGSGPTEILFEDCRVGSDGLVGADGGGLSIASGALDIGRFSVAAGSVGLIQACLEACVGYAATRRQGGALLCRHQLIQQMISTIACNAQAARLLVWHAARLKDQRSPDTLMATCIAKQFAATAAVEAANQAVQLHGARGCTDDYPVGRYLRDAKVMEIIEGSTQIQHLLIADYACQNRARVVPIA